jgi:adenosylhomocysteine nucleosidase
MSRTLIVAALPSEFFLPSESNSCIYYSGIGKINATHLITQLMIEEQPELVLNVGTAGCLRSELLGGVFGINEVIERDMNAEPLAPRGVVPFSSELPFLRSDFGSTKCATGDSFVTGHDKWLFENEVDLVDMELFAIAKIVERYGAKWRAIKFASDLANEDAAENWNDSLSSSNSKISEMITQALDF